jgi:hypothetical protein
MRTFFIRAALTLKEEKVLVIRLGRGYEVRP